MAHGVTLLVLRKIIVGLPILGLLVAGQTAAIAPARHYHDLVAGRGDRGFRDGAFYEALFDRPSGLAIDPAGKRLFVADTGNRRIRVVRLDDKNRVETVAGSGDPGQTDGPARDARFAAPTALAWLPDGRLAIADGGRLRLLDVAKQRVETVTSGIPPADIWGLVCVPDEDALYFTQPSLGALRRLDLPNGRVTTLVERSGVLPRPAALGLLKGALLVSDLDSGQLFTLGAAARSGGANADDLRAADRAEGLVGLAVSGERPFFVGGGLDSWGRLLPYQQVSLMTAFGELFDPAVRAGQTKRRNALIDLETKKPAGFLADPREERRFFLAMPLRNRIVSLTDYRFAESVGASTSQTNGLADFDYPARKPPNTVRILVVGDSRTRDGGHGYGQPPGLDEPVLKWGRMNTFPKKLELQLAMDAALDDEQVHYEVLTVNSVVSYRLIVWPYYLVPEIVKTYAVDVVLFLLPSDLSVRGYFDTPLTDQGIPSARPDPEYLVKPDVEKLTDPALKRLFDACRAKQLATVDANERIQFSHLDRLMPHPEIRTELAELIGRPFRLLDGALGAGPGPKPTLYLVYAPFTEVEPVDPFQTLLADIATRDGLKVIDLSNAMVALRTTLYGYTELVGNYHLRPGGHEVVAHILAGEVRRRLGKR